MQVLMRISTLKPHFRTDRRFPVSDPFFTPMAVSFAVKFAQMRFDYFVHSDVKRTLDKCEVLYYNSAIVFTTLKC